MRSIPAAVRVLVALVASFLVASTLLAAPSSATDPDRQAPQRHATCTPPDCWVAGAINIKTHPAHAYAQFIAPTRRAARHKVMQSCLADTGPKKDKYCKRAGVQRNGCLAIAYRRDADGVLQEWSHGEAGYRRAVGKRATMRTAARRARAKLDAAGTKHIALNDCTPRR